MGNLMQKKIDQKEGKRSPDAVDNSTKAAEPEERQTLDPLEKEKIFMDQYIKQVGGEDTIQGTHSRQWTKGLNLTTYHLSHIDSTMNLSTQFPRSCVHRESPYCFVADEQSEGRG